MLLTFLKTWWKCILCQLKLEIILYEKFGTFLGK